MSVLQAQRLKGVDAALAQVVYAIANRAKAELNVSTTVVYGYRSAEEQERLYAQGRTTPGNVVTRARGGQSPHNFFAAVDIAPVRGGKVEWENAAFWAIVSQEVAKRPELVWGGGWASFPDRPHIELKNWRDVRAGSAKVNPYLP